MASDNFDDTNGTGLEVHDANWTDIDATRRAQDMEIQSNHCRCENAWTGEGAYYDASTEDTSQIVFVAYTPGSTYRRISARVDTDMRGYSAALTNVSEGNYTGCTAYKNNVWLGGWAGSWACDENHLIKINTPGTTTVTIKVWIDDVALTPDKSDAVDPLGAAHPGFETGCGADVTASDVDDWTDGAAPPSFVPYPHPLLPSLDGGMAI